MGFEMAGNFLGLAAKKYNLDRQARAGLVCERARQVIHKNFPNFSEHWQPAQFVNGVLSIHVVDSAASTELFLKTFELLQLLAQESMPHLVREIQIRRAA